MTTVEPAEKLGTRVAFTPDGKGVRIIGDHLRDKEHKTLPRVVKGHLSHSYASSFNSCPARLVAERAQTRTFELFGAGELGTAGHTVMEELLKLPPAKRTPDEAIRIVNWLSQREPQGWRDVDYSKYLTDEETRTKWLAEVVKSYSGLFKTRGADPTTIDVVALELALSGWNNGQQWNSKIGNVPTVGFIDLVDRYEDTRTGQKVIRITDFKTGKFRSPFNGQDDQGDQIREYAAAAEQLLGEPVKRGRLLFTAESEAKARAVSVAPGEVKKTVTQFEDTWVRYREAGERNYFETKPSALCGWCPLLNACAAGQQFKAEREDQGKEFKHAETLLTAEELEVGVISAADAALLPSLDGSDGVQEREVAHIGEVAEEPLEPDANEANNETENTVTTKASQTWREAKSFDGPLIDGHVNTNSYEAQAVSHLLSLALERAHQAGVLKPGIQHNLASTYDALIAQAMKEVIGRFDRGLGLHSRMRGFLISHLAIKPEPFGQPHEVWKKWMGDMKARLVQTTNTLLTITASDSPDFGGWKSLAEPAVAQAEEVPELTARRSA